MSRLFRRAQPRWSPEQFWDWFQSEEGQRLLLSFTRRPNVDMSKTAAAVGKQLRRIHPELAWQLVPAEGSSPGVFEVSADGNSALIPLVKQIVAAAPAMPRWHIVAFKQPGAGFAIRTSGGGQDVSSASVLCVAKPRDGGRFDLNVFVPLPAAAPKPQLAEIGFIILDATLGEYAVMTKLGRLEFDTTVVAPPGAVSLEVFAASLLGEESS